LKEETQRERERVLGEKSKGYFQNIKKKQAVLAHNGKMSPPLQFEAPPLL
jgi:hypothetical protein